MDDKDLRISIDGANQNTCMYHHMGNLQIHADILKSVAIQVGRNSVVNGGLGGVVRFETKEAGDLLSGGERFGARVQGAYATNASASYSVTGYGLVTSEIDALGYYDFIDRDNYEVGGGDIVGADGDQVPGTDGEVRGLEGELDDALIKLGWNAAPGHRFEVGYERCVDEGDYSYRPDMGLATDLAIAQRLGVPLVYPTRFTRDTYTLSCIAFGSGLALVPGIRFERYEPETAVVDDTFTEPTFALALEYRGVEDLLLRASATELFKGPEIGEVLVGAGLFDSPNPGIGAESGVNMEVNAVWQREAFSAGITGFRTEIDDYIYDYAANPAGGTWKDNVGNMTIDGFEAYMGLRGRQSERPADFLLRRKRAVGVRRLQRLRGCAHRPSAGGYHQPWLGRRCAGGWPARTSPPPRPCRPSSGVAGGAPAGAPRGP